MTNVNTRRSSQVLSAIITLLITMAVTSDLSSVSSNTISNNEKVQIIINDQMAGLSKYLPSAISQMTTNGFNVMPAYNTKSYTGSNSGPIFIPKSN